MLVNTRTNNIVPIPAHPYLQGDEKTFQDGILRDYQSSTVITIIAILLLLLPILLLSSPILLLPLSYHYSYHCHHQYH